MGDYYVCIGGFDIAAGRNIRLLNSQGKPPKSDAPFQVGDIWNVTYEPLSDSSLVMPHAEDVRVLDCRLKTSLDSDVLLDFIYRHCAIYEGPIQNLFGGHLVLGRGAACIEKSAVPDHSVCFWEISTPLHHRTAYEKHKYFYEEGETKVWLPYVGTADPIEIVRSPGLARVSLARWWKLAGSDIEEKCYLQLSGWY